MHGIKYCIVKFDNLSLKEDPGRPGRSLPNEQTGASSPIPLEGRYDNPADCIADIDKLMRTAEARGSENIDIMLANGSRYIGPRYTYAMGEVEV